MQTTTLHRSDTPKDYLESRNFKSSLNSLKLRTTLDHFKHLITSMNWFNLIYYGNGRDNDILNLECTRVIIQFLSTPNHVNLVGETSENFGMLDLYDLYFMKVLTISTNVQRHCARKVEPIFYSRLLTQIIFGS